MLSQLHGGASLKMAAIPGRGRKTTPLLLSIPIMGRKTTPILLLLFTAVAQISGQKLNVPRVLLPFSSTPPKFPLKSDSGCFRWTSNRPEVVKVKPTNQEGSGCSKTAEIVAVGHSGSKTSAMVMAEDPSTGLILRADVIVDTVKSLQVVTKTHELYLEETPEKFQVRAYDEEGNEFSTLEGLVFKWTLESLVKTGADIVRFIPWRDSPYNTEPFLEKLESEGNQGNKVLLEGIKTGSAKVSVKLVDPLHKVPVVSVNLMVVANLFLVPPIAYILPGAALTYTANQFKGNRLHRLALPSPHHQLAVDNATLADLDQDTATVTGLTPGMGLVELVDQNVGPGEVVKTPTADLHVVPPARLELTCLPHNSWSVLVDGNHQILVELFDIDNNKIYPSDNLAIDLDIKGIHWNNVHSLANGTLHTGIPIKAGSTPVVAMLKGIRVGETLHPLPSPLMATATMDIYEGIKLTPPRIVFPWDPVTAKEYTVDFKVTGGEAPFSWSSSDSSVGVVSQVGVANVATGDIGVSTVTAAMARAMHNKGTAIVEVVPAVSLALLDTQLEVEVGQEIGVPIQLVAMEAGVKLPFNRCDKLDFHIELSDGLKFLATSGPPAGDGCASVKLSSSKVGHTKLTVEFSYVGLDGITVILQDSVTIASYLPLTPLSPASAETVMAVDSSRQLAWSGGPLPWPLAPSYHISNVDVESPSLVTVEASPQLSSVYTYTAKCLGIGETTVTLIVGNDPSATLPKPVTKASSITVICGVPNSIHIIPHVESPTGLPPCPGSARAGRVATHSYLPLILGVTIKDSSGRVFDSADTVAVDWKITDHSLADLANPTGVLSHAVPMSGYSKPGLPYQVLEVKSLTGGIDVTATLVGSGGLLGLNAASDTVLLQLVDDAVVEPNAMELFHHPSATGLATTRQGSGYFHLHVGDAPVTQAVYHANNRSLSVRPENPGSSILTVQDLCLTVRSPAVVAVGVAGVVRVELAVRDKIELGSEATATVKLYSREGLLPASALKYITLVAGAESEIVSVDGQDGLTVQVSGAKLGHTKLTATAVYGDMKVSSKPAPIQVFPPLRLEPRVITLVIGATFQVLAHGGPQDASIVYSATGEEAGVVGSGLITGLKLGDCSVVGKAVSQDGEVVYSQDMVLVHVVPLSGMRIASAVKRLVVGTAMPLYLVGTDEGQDVYSWASAVPNIEVDWSMKGEGGVEGVWYGAGLDIDQVNAGVAVLKATRPGRITITANIRITSPIPLSEQFQLTSDKPLSATIDIVVVENLQFMAPSVPSNTILLAPSTTYQLVTNRLAGKVTYSLCGGASGITVSRRGLLTAGSQAGEASVVAKVEEEGGALQEVSVVVEVRPVVYIMASVVPAGWKADAAMTKLPRGSSVSLEVTSHDRLGRTFHASQLDLTLRPNRFDLVRLVPGGSNSTMTLTAMSTGYTVIKLWDRSSGLTTWAVSSVGEGVMPHPNMGVGDLVDFDCPIAAVKGGSWVAEPTGLLDIDPENGVGVARRAGHVRVKYLVGEKQIMSSDIDISPATVVSLGKSSALTAGQGVVSIPVLLGKSGSNVATKLPEETKANPGNIFTCEASWDQGEVSSVFSVTPSFMGSSWACTFTPVKGSSAPNSPCDITLTVTLTQSKAQSTSIISYLPPFSASPATLEVSASGSNLVISGHPSVLSSLSTWATDGLTLSPSTMTEDRTMWLPVSLSGLHSGALSVTVSHPATGQTITVPVKPVLTKSCPSESRSLLSALLYDIAVHYQTVATLIAACALCVIVTRQMLTGKSAPPPVSKPAAPPVAATPCHDAQKPFLWTQDQSPIYGSPIFRRSPPSQPRNMGMAQYSYE